MFPLLRSQSEPTRRVQKLLTPTAFLFLVEQPRILWIVQNLTSPSKIMVLLFSFTAAHFNNLTYWIALHSQLLCVESVDSLHPGYCKGTEGASTSTTLLDHLRGRCVDYDLVSE